MKNIPIILFCFTYLIFSQESGWENFGKFKYQKLIIPQLANVIIDEKNQSFFTLYKNGTIRKWELNSGRLIDSFKITSLPQTIYFSNDRKSIVVSYYDNIYSQIVKVISLNNYDLIDSLKIETFANCYVSGLSYYENQTNFKLDYISELNTLLVSSMSRMGGTFGAGSIVFRDVGNLGFTMHTNDSTIHFKNISCHGIMNFTYSNNEIIFSRFYRDELKDPKNGSSYSSNYGINKFSFTDNKLYELLAYQTNNLIPFELAISTLYYLTNLNLLLFKSNYKIQYFNLKNNKIIDNFYIPCESNTHTLLENKNLFLVCNYDTLCVYDINTTNLKNEIILPIKPSRIVNIDNNLIAFNSSGEILLINSDEYFIIEDININNGYELVNHLVDDELNLKKNHDNYIEYKIYDIYGERIKQGVLLGNIIDVSKIKNGVYFLNIDKNLIKFGVVH